MTWDFKKLLLVKSPDVSLYYLKLTFFFRWELEMGSVMIKCLVTATYEGLCFLLLPLLFSVRGYPETRLKCLLDPPFLLHFYCQWLCFHWGPHCFMGTVNSSQIVSPPPIYSVPYHQINVSEILLPSCHCSAHKTGCESSLPNEYIMPAKHCDPLPQAPAVPFPSSFTNENFFLSWSSSLHSSTSSPLSALHLGFSALLL